MSKVNAAEQGPDRHMEPSNDDNMDVVVEGETLQEELNRPGCVAVESKRLLDSVNSDVETTAVEVEGNEDHGVAVDRKYDDKKGVGPENSGFLGIKEDSVNNKSRLQQLENILAKEEEEGQSCGNQIGDTLVNENVLDDSLPGSDKQLMEVDEKELLIEGNRYINVSSKYEENKIGDASLNQDKKQIENASLSSEETKVEEVPSNIEDRKSKDTSADQKEKSNEDTPLHSEEKGMGDMFLTSEENQTREESVPPNENQIKALSLKSSENQIEDTSAKSEDTHFEDAWFKDKDDHFKNFMMRKDTMNAEGLKQPFILHSRNVEGDDSGTEEEQAAFMKELQNFYKERSLEFKSPKFYGEGLNCLKLWRAVTRLGGYDQVTSSKLWRQVGESFKPPKTCTTVSWTFRCFYEKALLEYEKHKIQIGELEVSVSATPEPISVENQVIIGQPSGSGRARRDAAARAMQGWHSQRLLGNGEVGDAIIKDKGSTSYVKRDKQLKSVGVFKRKKSSFDRPVKAACVNTERSQTDNMVIDIGLPAEWVKINVRQTKDCFEVYALVPGLLREEVHVQSDPAGRLVISGDPEQLDNPWGVTPFKKIVTLPSRIDPHQTSAIVTLHGQLFVRAPFEQPVV